MPKIIFLIGIIISITTSDIFAEIKSILPLKKPILTNTEIQKKITKNILTPIKKPSNKKEANNEKIISKDKKEKIYNFKIPKKKPTTKSIVKTSSIKISKYYNKKDFSLAKKSISEMERGKWNSALKTAEKARDKSIYNFINWRYLLTTGNQASFFNYQVFINQNPEYPRIDRLKYLAEHKLSTESVSPKKIINWFNDQEPLSGYGKMILGESYVLIGNKDKGIKLIKEGWITADLTKNEFERPYFIEDKKVKTKSADWRNYKNSGYDRGHLVPAGDRRMSFEAYNETFLTSNISPQDHDFNAGIWNRLEQKVRYWAEKYDGVYVVTGGVLKGKMKTIGEENVSVPNEFYKIVVDFSNGEYKAVAFLIPNKPSSESFYEYAVSIDEVEAKTGIDFFPQLPDSIENNLESMIDLRAWGRR